MLTGSKQRAGRSGYAWEKFASRTLGIVGDKDGLTKVTDVLSLPTLISLRTSKSKYVCISPTRTYTQYPYWMH